MQHFTLEELDKLIENGKHASAYAQDHFEELAARKHTYTLYGPKTIWIGACVPCKFTPKRERVLSQKTKRKSYCVYELDENYTILRNIHIENGEVDCTFHHFWLEGIHYAKAFFGNGKRPTGRDVFAVKYADGKPIYYAHSGNAYVFAKYLEYQNAEKMLVSTYDYSQERQFTYCGLAVDPQAPFWAPNSIVSGYCEEEDVVNTDFSQWFK